MACLMTNGEHHVASDRINQRPKWPSHSSRNNQPAGRNEHRQRDHKQRDCRPREKRNWLARIRDRPNAVGSRTHQQRSLEESSSAVKQCACRYGSVDQTPLYGHRDSKSNDPQDENHSQDSQRPVLGLSSQPTAPLPLQNFAQPTRLHFVDKTANTVLERNERTCVNSRQ